MNYLQLKELEKSEKLQHELLKKCKININEKSLEILRKEIEELKKKIEKESCETRSMKKPHSYQSKIAKHILEQRGLIVFHTVGSGKTLTSILCSQCYLDKFPNNKVIVITPSGLKDNFIKEMKTAYGNIIKEDKYEFYSYEKFTRENKKMEKIKCQNSLIIIDEAHNLRTSFDGKKGIRNGIITECAEKAHRVLLLSGTPIYNNYKDIVSLYNMIRPIGEKKWTEKTFKIEFLKCKISYYSPDILTDPNFPKKRIHDIYIDMSPSYLIKYDKMIDYIQGNASKTIDSYDPLKLQAFYNKIRRAANELDSVDGSKIRYIYNEIIKNDKKKIIVYSNFLASGNKILEELLKANNIPYGYIEGDKSLKDRTKLVQLYNENKIRVLLLSKAGGEGLDLKETNSVYILEPSWNQSNEDQVIGRAVRFKSHKDSNTVVDIYHLYHIKPTDRTYFRKITDYIRDKTKTKIDNPLDPYDNSIDLFMKVLLEKKQENLNDFIEQIKNLTIEKNNCNPKKNLDLMIKDIINLFKPTNI